MNENERLKEVQKILGFKSQSEFADVIGIKQGSLSDIYRGKNGVGVSDSIKMKLMKEYSINIEWLETGVGTPILPKQNIGSNNSKKNINSNINGKVNGNITISHNDFSKLIDEYLKMQFELNERLKSSQNQLSESQKQINALLEIIKNKNLDR